MTEEHTNQYESEMTLDIFLNWLDRPDTAGLELSPREVKEVREMILNVKEELEVCKKALNIACYVLSAMADSNSDNEEWNGWLLQKAREE